MYAGSPTETPGSAIVDIPLGRTPVARLQPFLAPDAYAELGRTATTTCRLLAGRRVWAVSSAASGGGVAELLRTLLPYWRGCGVDVGWQVVRGTPEFFRVTKRLHNWLHGSRGDGGRLGRSEVAIFDRVSRWHADALVGRVARGRHRHAPGPAGRPPGRAAQTRRRHRDLALSHRRRLPPIRGCIEAWDCCCRAYTAPMPWSSRRPSFVPGEVHGVCALRRTRDRPRRGQERPAHAPLAAAELARGMGVVTPRPPRRIGRRA